MMAKKSVRVGWNALPQLSPLDVLVFRPDSIISPLIAVFSKARREGTTWARHVALAYDAHYISESTWPRTRIINLRTAYENSLAEIVVFRLPMPITSQTASEGQRLMEASKGRRYAWWRFGAHAIDRALFNNKAVVRKAMFIDSCEYCSWHVAFVYAQLFNYRFMHLTPKAAQPDDIADDLVQNNWPLIWATSNKAVIDLYRTTRRRSLKQ